MLQSQVLNVLPRRIVAGFWASQETRVSLSHLYNSNKNNQNEMPAATAPSFLCSELPVRYTHILRLLSTLSPEALKTPIVRHVAHDYLHDICTLLHPSLQSTSPRGFHNVARRLHQRQAANLIRLRYAFTTSPTAASLALLDNINTIGFGIHMLLDQHLSYAQQNGNETQAISPIEIAKQAAKDAQLAFSEALGGQVPVPSIAVKTTTSSMSDQEFTYIPNVLHRILYESSLVALRAELAHAHGDSWIQRKWKQFSPPPMELHVFGGPTSVGFRLNSTSPLLPNDMGIDIPRDPIGIPTCSSLLGEITRYHDSKKNASALSSSSDNGQAGLAEWEALSGWRAAKVLASHWGGNLDMMSVDGLGASIYLALDRDATLAERYPVRTLASAQLLRHHGRISAAAAAASSSSPLTIQAASIQLDTFLNAIAEQSPAQEFEYNPHYHSVSLSAAVGHA